MPKRRTAETMLVAKDNPFATRHVEALPFQFSRYGWQEHLQRLDDLGWRGMIVGPCGSGKTTLLLELHQHLQRDRDRSSRFGPACHCFVSRTPQVRARQYGELKRAIRQDRLLLIDGIERFRWWQRRRLFSTRSARLIATAHRPVATVPVWLHAEPTLPLAVTLLRQLVDDPSAALVTECERLYELHRGNIREIFRSLYDEAAAGMYLPFPAGSKTG